MKSSNGYLRLSILAALASGLIGLSATTGVTKPKAPRIETGPDAEVTHDGLYRVQRSVMDAAWAKPDLDLTRYDKLMLGTFGVSFKAIEPVSSARARSESEFPVKEENKAQLEEIMREEFAEELAKLQRYEIVAEPGPDVLMLVVGAIDVLSRVPPDVDSARFGRGGVYLTSVGEATLIVELRDSESGEVLARAADRRAAESPFAFEVNEVTAWSEVRRLGQEWAKLLVERLEELEGV